MSDIKLTKSQEQAIEGRKRIARMVHGDNVKEFEVWESTGAQGRKEINLTCYWTIKNALGGEIEKCTTWEISKRGAVSQC